MKALEKLYKGFTKTKALLVALVLCVYLALVAFGGGSIFGAVVFCGTVVMYILLPGLLLADFVKAKTRVPGLYWPVALLLGTGFFAALYCLAMALRVPLLVRLLPLLLGILWVLLGLRGQRFAPPAGGTRKRLGPPVWLLVLLWAALVGLYAFRGVVPYAHPAAVGDVLLDQDMLWNVGNANSFLLGFPPNDIRFAGLTLRYHFLTELLAGALSLVGILNPYDVLCFYLQPLMLAAMVLCLYRFARVVWPEGGQLKPLLFVFSHFLLSCASLWKMLPGGQSVFFNAYITHLVTNINSQTTATVYLCIFLGLFVQLARAKFRAGIGQYALLLLAFVMLCLAKGPLAMLVLIGVLLSVLVGLPLRKSGGRGVLVAALLAAVFAAIFAVLYAAGAGDSMSFSLVGTLDKGYFANILAHIGRLGLPGAAFGAACVLLMLAQAFLMLPAQAPLYLGSILRDLRRFKSLPLERLLFQAVAVGGLLAFFLFTHPSMSQMYFLFGGLFFINLLAVDSIDLLRRPAGAKRRWPRRLFAGFCAACLVVGLATTAFLYTNMVGGGARQVLRNAGVLEKYPYSSVMKADDEAAALWLRENTAADAVFATNRIHTGERAEGISNLYSAFSGRQAFMEGFQYAKTNMGVPVEEIQRRLAVNTALFDPDTPPAEVERLMRENGIGTLLYTSQFVPTEMYARFEEELRSGALAAAELSAWLDACPQMANLRPVYENGTVRVYALEA